MECLSHSPPTSTCCELRQTRQYYSGVISSLMRPDCQLRAFKVEVKASPRIAFLPYSYSWPTGLGISFGILEGTASGDVAPSPFVILVCRGQSRPRQYILAVWIPFVRSRAFLFLGMGFGLDMKWAKVPRSFGPIALIWAHY